jgi:hypothetical protein
MKYKIITIVLCILLMPFCVLYLNDLLFPPPLQLDGKPVTYYRYNIGTPEGPHYIIESNSPIYQSIQLELEKQRGWSPTIVSYVPGEVLQTDRMKLNCLKGAVVLNIQINESGDWGQFICERDQGISDLLSEIQKYVESHPMK